VWDDTGKARMKILIVKRDKLGDMLLTTPLIAQLRRSIAGAEVYVLASDYCGWVVHDDPDVARVWTYPRLRFASLLEPAQFFRYVRTLKEIRAKRFDVAISAGGEHSPRAVRKALEARAARTIAYAPKQHRYGTRLTHALEPPAGGHEVDRMLALAAPLGVTPPKPPIAPRFTLPARLQQFADAWLAQRRLARGCYVVLGLGTRRSVRQPSTAQILRWSERWRERYGLQTVFMWTPGKGSRLYPGDDEIAAPVLAASRADIHPYRGPLPEALGLIWSAAASVFPDSGLMHFAAASPGGVVGLFASSPSWPEQWAPRGPRARWLLAPASVGELTDAALFAELESLLLRGQGPPALRS
jgi:ADP-heptose:LPS heptosyltransferase